MFNLLQSRVQVCTSENKGIITHYLNVVRLDITEYLYGTLCHTIFSSSHFLLTRKYAHLKSIMNGNGTAATVRKFLDV